GHLTVDCERRVKLRKVPSVVWIGVLGDRNVDLAGYTRFILHDDDVALIDGIPVTALVIQSSCRRERRKEAIGRFDRWKSAGEIRPFDPRSLDHDDVFRPDREAVVRRSGA